MSERWRIVALLAMVAALNYADRTSLSVVFPLLVADLGLSDLQLAGIGTLFLWSYAFGSAGSGLVVDRWPRHRVVVWSLFAWSLVTIVTGFARTAQELLATRVFLGLAECFYLPAAVALIAHHHPVVSRGRALSLHLCGLNAGLVGGGALAGYLGEQYGWRVGLWVLGGLGVVLAAGCHFLLTEGAKPEVVTRGTASLGEQLSGLMKKRNYILLALQAMLISVGTWMFFTWMPLYFKETFGLSLAVAGFSGTAVLQVSGVLGALTGGAVSDYVARRFFDGRLRMMVICYLLCAPCLLVFLTGGGLMVVGTFVVLFSFLRSVATSSETPALCEMVEDRDRGTAQSLMNMLNTLAGGTGVFVAGYLKSDFGLAGVFAGVGLLVVIAAGLVWMARERRAIA